MYELSRIRVCSAGPAGARFKDVILDFSGAGLPVAAVQDNLFDAAPQVVRPSPASVVFLENGGGKSVLLKLLFSVVLPGRRQVRDAPDPRLLEDYVLARDVSHIVLEWMHSVTGRLLVTAKVLCWKDQVVSTVAENLVEHWYAFHPTDTLGLDTLPIVEDGQYRAMASYRESVKELGVQDQRLQMNWPKSHEEWTELLGQLGLDPELFRYQRAMNRDEGEAVHAFTLDSDGGFVDFLLKAVHDHKGLNELASLVSTYAHQLAGRKDLLLELDFVEQAMTLLEPLVEAADAVNAARVHVQQTGKEVAAFNGQVRARVRGDKDRLELLQRQEHNCDVEATGAAGLTRRWAATVARQRYRLAQLRFTRAKGHVEETARSTLDAKAVVEGWRATGPAHRHLAKSAVARGLALVVKQGEAGAEPAFQARQRSAEALARGLLGLQGQAQRAQEQQLAEARKHQGAEREARLAREAALKEAERAEGQATELLGRVAAAQAEAEQAVMDGLAPAAGLVPQAAADARQAVVRAADRINALEREQESVDRRQDDVQGTLSVAIREEEAARGRRGQTQRLLESAVARTSAIEMVPRGAELLGAAVRLEADAEVLLERLGAAIAESERERVALRVEQARDDVARLALQDGHLLPPPQVVVDACRLLQQSEPRIDAWPGWKYIAQLPPGQREEMLAGAPHLVSGVLLNSDSDQERAREVLGRATPTAYHVAVGTVAGLYEADGGPAQGVLFTLPFNAALYEEKAAEAEQKLIEERWARSEERLKELHRTQQHDAVVLRRVTQWREDYPAGTLAELREEHAAAVSALAEAEEVTSGQRLAMEALTERREDIRGELGDTRQDHEHWQKVSRRLAGLGERLAQIPAWREQAAAAQEQRGIHEEKAEEAQGIADEQRRAAEGRQAAGDEQRRAAAAAAQEWAELPGVQEMLFEGEPPSDPVPVLREAYNKAKDDFDRAAVPGELRARLVRAEEDAQEAAAVFSALPQADRDKALRLLQTPEALDERSRAEALELALRALAAAETADKRAAEEKGRHENALSERRQEFREQTADGTEPMPPGDVPDTIEWCLETVADAEKQYAVARTAEAAALSQQEAAAEQTRRAKDAAETFERLSQVLTDAAAEPDAVPYAGDGDAVWRDHLRLDAAARKAKEDLNHTEKTLRRAAEHSRRHAAGDQYSRLTIPVRQQIIELSAEQTAEHATKWLAALQTRRRNLSDEIDEVNQHRQTIVDHLKGESDKALSLLRSAQRLSKLPQSLGDWAEEEFIQFSFHPQPDELLLPRLGELAEEAATGRTGDGRKVARDGLSLMLRAVHTAVPAGFKVHVLKPDMVLRTERVRVSKVKNVFSGGQQLTAAILLYCTMAALRANQKGRERSRHAGVLFLDNPIGRANAEYLLDLQRQVAQALGVQLVYTTGLYDEKALGKFPLIVRLRNDADLRAARKYLVVDDVFRPHLDTLDPEDGTGRIDSARIFRREEPRGIFGGDDGTATPGE
ncbi:hypothetical protein ACFYT4_32810 [Streptomyces sp. NPDC004609]|uniref:hypothetical protein n=1 Tax=Streptomyces sp. NPDC004609 TaxID=3364704 RepID=UPI0036C6984C